MCHLWNEYEYYVLQSGQVCAQRPRLHITTTMQNVGAAMHSMMMNGGVGAVSGNSPGMLVSAGGAHRSMVGIPPPPIAPGQRLLLQQQQQRRAASNAGNPPLASALRGGRTSNASSGITTPTVAPPALKPPSTTAMSHGSSTGSSTGMVPSSGSGRARSNSSSVAPAKGTSIYETLEARRLRLANAANTTPGGDDGRRSRSNSYDSAGGQNALGSQADEWKKTGYGGALGAIYSDDMFPTAPSTNQFPVSPKPPNTTTISAIPPRLTSDSLPKTEVDRFNWLMNHSGSNSNSTKMNIPSAPVSVSPTVSNPRGIARSATEDEYAEVIGNFIDEDDFSAPSTTPRTAFRERKNNTNPAAAAPMRTIDALENSYLPRMNTTSTTASSTVDYGYSNSNFNIFGAGPSEDNLGKY